jgi:hypothetical protein
MKKVTIDPEVLDELAQLARVKDFPVIENIYGCVVRTTVRENFNAKIGAIVWTANHFLNDPTTRKAAAKAGPLVRELKEHLESSDLSQRLSSSDIATLSHLAKGDTVF